MASIRILVLFLLSLSVNAQQIESFGELFLVEEKISLKGSTQHQLFYSTVVNSSAYRVQSLNYTFSYFLNDFFNVGLSVTGSQSDKSYFLESMQSSLQNNITVQSNYPNGSLALKIGLLPIKGNLNWFNSGSLPFYISTDLGIGIANADSSVPMGYLAGHFNFDITSNWGALFGFRQNLFIFKYGSEMSSEVSIGTSYTFF
jgi:hypothetical protein